MPTFTNHLLAHESSQQFMPDFIAADSPAAQRFMAQYHAETGYSQIQKDSEDIGRWSIVVDVSGDESGPCLTFSSPDGGTTFSVSPSQEELYLAFESFSSLPQMVDNGVLIGVDWFDLVALNGNEPWQFKHIQANDVHLLKDAFMAFIADSGIRFAVMLLLLPGDGALDNMIEIASPLPEEVQVVFQLRILEEIKAVSSLPQICLFWRI